MDSVKSRIGFEIELLAPAGGNRRLLADRVANDLGGRVERVFHTDSEPSLVPGMGHFWHLTPGFTVYDASGAEVATIVDDVTLVSDIRNTVSPTSPAATEQHDDQRTEGSPDAHWYRILSDDTRLLRLVAQHTSPDTPFHEVLDSVGRLFTSPVETIGSVRRLQDSSGASIAMATSLPAGRERPCEIVTPPLSENHEGALEDLLRPARDLKFVVPAEAAVHLHLDGAPFRNSAAFSNLVRLFTYWREPLRVLLGTNPLCTRLQPLPHPLLTLIESTESERNGGDQQWGHLQSAAAETGLTKYFDVNLTSLLTDTPFRDTVEIRILPGLLHASDILRRARLLEGLLDRCLSPDPFPRPPDNTSKAIKELERISAR